MLNLSMIESKFNALCTLKNLWNNYLRDQKVACCKAKFMHYVSNIAYPYIQVSGSTNFMPFISDDKHCRSFLTTFDFKKQ